MTLDLFQPDSHQPWNEFLTAHTTILHGYAKADASALFLAINDIIALSPLCQMTTPGGLAMSVATTSCGQYGWVSDRHGYRYSAVDPLSGKPWPAMPESFTQLAASAAASAGFNGFAPDACLINRYLPGSKMGLHQDKDERDFNQPIVSVSLGLPVVFQFGGLQRTGKTQRILLTHGDVVVWGGEDRLRFHGVLALKPGRHELLGAQRINLTFRKAS